MFNFDENTNIPPKILNYIRLLIRIIEIMSKYSSYKQVTKNELSLLNSYIDVLATLNPVSSGYTKTQEQIFIYFNYIFGSARTKEQKEEDIEELFTFFKEFLLDEYDQIMKLYLKFK